MKKIFEIIGFLSLMLFTFTYTSKISMVIKENDDLLSQIKEVSTQYKKDPINATIKDNTIVAGVSGSQIDIDESYSKMKKLNQFNSNLFVYEKVKPDISVFNNYDKYIAGGIKNEVSIIFLVEE